MHFIYISTFLLHTAGIIDSPANSLFTYQPGESWATYYDPYFVPTYQTLFNDSDLAAQADELCSDDSFNKKETTLLVILHMLPIFVVKNF